MAEGGLERLRGLRGMTWRWGTRASRRMREAPQMGVVAQDVEKVFPGLVTTGRDGYKRVNYVGLIGPLIEAVKELDERLSRIEAKLDQRSEAAESPGRHDPS